jgi:3-hydroxyacyl-[acyl-carrier-protein] dehydratase
MPDKTVFSLEEILKLLPHRPPFLFVDRITGFNPGIMITGKRIIRPDEYFFAGHFPGKPVMPGVLVVDGLAQISGLLWGFSRRVKYGGTSEKPEIFYLAAVNVKFINPAMPGDCLEMTAYTDRNFGTLFSYNVEAAVGRKVIVKGSLTLAMMKGGSADENSAVAQ